MIILKAIIKEYTKELCFQIEEGGVFTITPNETTECYQKLYDEALKEYTQHKNKYETIDEEKEYIKQFSAEEYQNIKKQQKLKENENNADIQTQNATTATGISLKTEEKISFFGKVAVNIITSFYENDENFKKILQGMKNVKYCNEDNEVIELTPEQQLQTIKELVEKDDAIWNERYIENIKKIEECKSAEELDKLKINYE